MSGEQEVELNLRLDGNGRTASDAATSSSCSVDYSSKTVMSRLASSDDTKEGQKVLDDLLYDCEIADCGLLPRTFWIPAVGTKPRCRLEQMAVEVFHQHVPKGFTYDAATSGAEWWVQIRPSPPLSGRYSMHAGDDDDDTKDMSKTGISFHWDKDEDLRLAMGGTMYLHPHLSTVTYLTDLGAPTMALNYRVNNLTGEYIEPSFGDGTTTTAAASSVAEGYVSWPRKGKHLSFDGRYLHAAPGDLMEEGEFDRQCKCGVSGTADGKELQILKRRHRRVTFLVNVWLNYKPLHVDLFPESMINKLSVQDAEKTILFDTNSKEQSGASRCKDEHAVVDGASESDSSKVFMWPMGGCSSDESIRAMMPLHTIRKEKENGGNIHIEWKSWEGTGNGQEGNNKGEGMCGISLMKGGGVDNQSVVPPDSKRQKVAA